MNTRTATLIIRFKGADGAWQRAPIAMSANGRIRPGYALIDDKPKELKKGSFYYQVRYYDHRKLKYAAAGRDANKAETLRRKIEHQRSVIAEAKKADVQVHVEEGRKTLAGTAAEYIRDAEDRNANEAAQQARIVTEEFIRTTGKTYLDEVSRKDILRFHAALHKRGCGDRTVSNKHDRLKSWLVFAGFDAAALPPGPRYEEKLPTIYTSDEISSILGATGPDMSLAIGLALKCGLREQELAHLEWADLDEDAKVIQVRGKEKYRFKVKDSEQREVPVPDELLADLAARKASKPGTGLILPTPSGQPNHKLLRQLKRTAKAADLNCGHCEGCKSPARECRGWTLHKFRRTYCTTLLRNEFDLRTVQSYMGHADLASTMRYLRPAASSEVRVKLNGVKW